MNGLSQVITAVELNLHDHHAECSSSYTSNSTNAAAW